MKLKILALSAVLTICTVAPVEAGSVVDFRISDDGPGINIVPYSRRHRDYDPRYRYDWNHRPRYHRRYRDNRYYHPRYWNYRPRYRSGRYYHPRGSYIQFRIGF
jgi:hypothetical protein